MKSKKNLILLVLFISVGLFNLKKGNAQSDVPADVAAIVKMKLDDGQAKLKDLGYEICFSSLFGKKQDWFNESTQNCVTVKFDKKKIIKEVLLNPEITKCQKGLDASRKVWEKYHDGQAPVSTTKLDEERKKLTDKGFKVSYWIDEISPGRSSEYWVNDTTQKTMYIVWEVQGNKWVMTEKTEYKRGENPAPTKN